MTTKSNTPSETTAAVLNQNFAKFTEESANLTSAFSLAEILKLRLDWISKNFPDQIKLSTSFGKEDQVLVAEARHFSNVEFFTIDTGRLFEETYKIAARTREFFNVKIHSYHPNAESLGAFVDSNGPNAFYTSPELRLQCCAIRKVEPLKRALQSAQTWICGLRKSQNAHRSNLPWVEFDADLNVLKVYPILDWTDAQIDQYVSDTQIPVHSLHSKGFLSIGCAPCTRAVAVGEDPRAGRWWWEDQSKKECGLHLAKHS